MDIKTHRSYHEGGMIDIVSSSCFVTTQITASFKNITDAFSKFGDTISNSAKKLNKSFGKLNIEIYNWLNYTKEKCYDKVGFKTLKEEIKDWLLIK